MKGEESRRQKLDSYVGSGQLRYDLEMKGVDSDVIDLLVDIAAWYCAPRKSRKKVSKKGGEGG